MCGSCRRDRTFRNDRTCSHLANHAERPEGVRSQRLRECPGDVHRLLAGHVITGRDHDRAARQEGLVARLAHEEQIPPPVVRTFDVASAGRCGWSGAILCLPVERESGGCAQRLVCAVRSQAGRGSVT